jgi:hypothetical protein
MTMTMIPEVRAIRTDNISNINAAAVKDTSTLRSRLANIAAAKADPKQREAYAIAERGCARLGFSIDDIASAGGVAKLDEAARRLHWTVEERINLKTALAKCGAIA